MADKVFADGIYFDLPREGAPEFVKGRVSFKVAEAVAFLEGNVNNAGYVNIDLKVSQNGKAYAELNQWKPSGDAPVAPVEEPATPIEYPSGEINPDDIPF